MTTDRFGELVEKLTGYALARVDSDTTDGGDPVAGVRGRSSGALAVALSVALVASMVVPVAAFAVSSGAAASTASAAPAGMVGVPSAAVSSDLPDNTPMGQSAKELAEAGVYTSAHADSLEVVVTSPGRAKNQYTGGSMHGGGPLAIVFADDVESAGREVAVDAAELEDILGYRPTAAFGTHTEAGADDEWSREIRYENGYAVVEVPGFSSNTVTFSGGITLTGDAATDGTRYQYSLDDLDGVDNYTINLTGSTATANDSSSGRVTDGESIPYDVGGNAAPTGEEVTFTGVETTTAKSNTGSATNGDSVGITVGGNQDPTDDSVTLTGKEDAVTEHSYDEYGGSNVYGTVNDGAIDSQFKWDNPPDVITNVRLGLSGGTGYDPNVDVYIHQNGIGNSWCSGDLVASGWNGGSDLDIGQYTAHDPTQPVVVNFCTTSTTSGSDMAEVPYESGNAYHYSRSGGSTYTRFSGKAWLVSEPRDVAVSTSDGQTVNLGNFSDGQSKTADVNITQSTTSVSFDGTGGAGYDYEINWTEHMVSEDPSVDLDGDGAADASYAGTLADGATHTEAVSLSTGSHSANASTTGGSEVDLAIDWTERTETVDPVVDVNGNTVSYNGRLADGETVSLGTSTGWLKEGQNNVTVRLSDPSSGPVMETGMNYEHEANGVSEEIIVESTTWRDVYNASRTYPSNESSSTATFQMQNGTVGIFDVETRRDGGSWSSVDEANRTFDSAANELVVDLGSVSEDETVTVRANASKVRVYDGEIRVLEPTVEGDDLATEFEVTSLASDGQFGIDVSGTPNANRVHYLEKSSWTDRAYVETMANGDQIVRAPDANAGSVATVATVPVEVRPESGAMEVLVEDPDASKPRFQLREGNTVGAATVEVGYYNTLSGERYVLWSETEDREIDADRAESPAWFVTDGSDETYSIFQQDARGGTGTGTGPAPAAGGGLRMVLVFPAVALSVGGLWFIGRKYGGATGIRGNAVLLVGSAIVAVVAAESVTARSLTSDFMFAVSGALASGAGAVIFGLAVLVGLWALDERTAATVPRWLMGLAAFLVVVMAAEAMRPGSVLGALEGVLTEIGAAVVLIGLLGGIVLLYRRASTPENKIVLGGDDK